MLRQAQLDGFITRAFVSLSLSKTLIMSPCYSVGEIKRRNALSYTIMEAVLNTLFGCKLPIDP